MVRVRALAALWGAFLAPSVVGAQTVEIWCPRISADDAMELVARAKLALRALPPPPRAVVVGCDDAAAALIWDGPPLERRTIDESSGLVEGALEAIETRAREGRRTEPKPDPRPSRAETPPDFAKPRLAVREIEEEIGGVGLRFVLEPSPEDTALVGPHFDVGVGLGRSSFVVALNEGARFALADTSIQVITLSGGIAWGAPYVPKHWFGAALLGGAEWVFSSDRTSRGGPTSAILMPGVRAAVNTHATAFWFGVDALLRSRDPSLGGTQAFELSQATVLVSLGGVLLVRSGKLEF